MKSFSKTSFILSFACMGFVLAMGVSPSATADENVASASPEASAAQPQHRHHRHGRKKSFRMGMCVGQALAAQGVVVPPHVPGQPRQAPDAGKRAAFKSAIQSCHAQYKRGPKPAST